MGKAKINTKKENVQIHHCVRKHLHSSLKNRICRQKIGQDTELNSVINEWYLTDISGTLNSATAEHIFFF